MSYTWEYQIVIKLNQRKVVFSPPFSSPPPPTTTLTGAR